MELNMKNSFDIKNILRKDMEKQIKSIYIFFKLQKCNTIRLFNL